MRCYGDAKVITTRTKAGYFFAALLCLTVPLGLTRYSYILALAALPLFAAILAGYFCQHSSATINKLWGDWLDEAKNERKEWQQMLARHVPVLPVLAGQLRATVEQVEQVQTLAQELAQAARVIQFSDAVRERLNHVAQTLVATEKALYIDLAGMSLPGDQKTQSDNETSGSLNKDAMRHEGRGIFRPHLDPAVHDHELLNREI